MSASKEVTMSHMTNKKRRAREANALLRGVNGFNTGTRTHKNEKYDNNRQKVRVELRKTAQNEF